MKHDLKQDALAIFSAAVHAADPGEGIRRSVKITDDAVIISGRSYPFARYTRILVVGAGKASACMGLELEDILGGRIDGGHINTKYGHAENLQYIEVTECGHPVPDGNGVKGAECIARLLDSADESTLVVALLSGGGSALMPAPAPGISLDDKQDVTQLLLKSGATITELNAVRKHLSTLKGGGMARLAAPAALELLILSDVIGDRLDTIASGPAVADESSFSFCMDVFKRYDIFKELPPAVRERFEKGVRGDIPETAKTGDGFLQNVGVTLVGNNRQSVDAACLKAGELGYGTLVLSTVLEGEAREMGTFFAKIASEIVSSGNPIPSPACIIAGGETTVKIAGDGLGGRNQEMALSAARSLDGIENVVFLSGGTDGTDGPTDAAGGLVDGATAELGREKGVSLDSFLARNDSYNYLDAVGGLIKSGPTGTNVMDIQVLLVESDIK